MGGTPCRSLNACIGTCSPIDNHQDVWLCELGGDLLEEGLLPPHQGRLAVDHPHEQVGVQAETVDPRVEVGLDVHACNVLV